LPESTVDQRAVTLVLVGAFVAWAIYRRIRRSIGRQPVSPGRMQARIVILALALALVTFASRAVHSPELGGALLAGLAAGAALGYLGLRHTKFETTPEGSFYTPHTYIGVTVSALLIARVVYRFVANDPAALAAAQANGDPFASYHSPLTLAIVGVVVGYYVLYYLGVLMKSRDGRVPADDSSPP
jgi:hypothetical protein